MHAFDSTVLIIDDLVFVLAVGHDAVLPWRCGSPSSSRSDGDRAVARAKSATAPAAGAASGVQPRLTRGVEAADVAKWSRRSPVTGSSHSHPVVMSKQTESSPFRFAEIAKEAGHRLRALLGHDRGEALPHRQRLGRGRIRL